MPSSHLTVVRPDDLADRILDREKYPQWQGERTKMAYAWPIDVGSHFPPQQATWSDLAVGLILAALEGRGIR